MGHGNGLGWGLAHPRVILDSGDEPTGKVFDLVWSDWGRASATARGLAWIILNAPMGARTLSRARSFFARTGWANVVQAARWLTRV
jgi:hypothetical protein